MPQLETEVIIRNGRVVGGSSSGVTDVEVDGTSVVNNGVAEIDLSGKQDMLTAGSNIQIAQDGTISATDTTYTAGTGINIDANNVISATGSGTITDVQVDGVSVVTSGVAEIDLTGKADTATTLAGYGITDANINNGTITLGNNTITPLTSHQDISGKVNKAGDTMTGSLTISNSSLGSCILKDNSYTINTSSNNGVSSFSGNNFEIQDSASTISTKFGNYLSSDGSVKAIISAHNKKTDGTATSNSLEIKIAKDGTRSYAVSDPAAFRSAIGAGTSSTNTTYTIGTSGNNITLTPSGGSAQSITAPFATVADRLSGFSSRSTSMGWGNQTGSVITCFSTSNGGGWGFRDNNPSSGQTSMVLDGTIYVMEGQKQVAHAGNVSTGDSNGQVKIAGVNVSVKGLGSAAYSNTSAFAAASHTHSYIPLSGSSTISGNLLRKLTNVTINKTSNNSCSSSSYSHNGWVDNASAYLAYVTCSAEKDGKNSIGIHCKNMNTSGTATENYLGCRILKAGTRSYYVGDAAQFRSAIGAAASSSREYKKNIKPITESEAKKILDVEICSFDYKKGFGDKGKEKGHFGVIAEDVKELFPQAVNIPEHYYEMDMKTHKKDNVLISVDYWKFLPHLIKVVQMQEQRINELEEKIKEMSK